MKTLAQWLQYCEQIHPQNIALGLERVAAVAKRMQLAFRVPVITVAGTNGKGSTCAMLEAILLQAGYRTGVYTSPHLVDFQERCRIDGAIIEPQDLVPSMELVEQARQQASPATELTYFEFTTLAIMDLLSKEQLDVVILEVGLGGRLDAVNVIAADCAIITSIDVDHVEFLGNSRESIGYEKVGVARSGKPLIVSDPMPPQTVIDYATEINADLYLLGRDFNYTGDRQQWNWLGREIKFFSLAYPALRGANQLINAAGVLAALESLRQQLPVTAQFIRNGLSMVRLPGRFQIVPGQPPLVLDVAHNQHAVAALARNLDAMGFFPCTYAIFGAMQDKEVAAMLKAMLPLIDRWYFVDLPTARAMPKEQLLEIWQQLNPRADSLAELAADASQALQQIKLQLKKEDRVVVFGSFYTVGEILQDGVPRIDMTQVLPI